MIYFYDKYPGVPRSGIRAEDGGMRYNGLTEYLAALKVYAKGHDLDADVLVADYHRHASIILEMMLNPANKLTK